MKNKKLIREQLDASLARFMPLRDVHAPSNGWIQAIRAALGMSARQLASRLGITQQAVARIEKNEARGSVTLRTMRNIAEGLDCVFVYGFVPRTTLDETVRRQARRLAEARFGRVSHTMGLEDQGLGKKENKKMLSDAVENIVGSLPSTLWNKP